MTRSHSATDGTSVVGMRKLKCFAFLIDGVFAFLLVVSQGFCYLAGKTFFKPMRIHQGRRCEGLEGNDGKVERKFYNEIKKGA